MALVKLYNVQCDGCGELPREGPPPSKTWRLTSTSARRAVKKAGWRRQPGSGNTRASKDYCPRCALQRGLTPGEGINTHNIVESL